MLNSCKLHDTVSTIILYIEFVKYAVNIEFVTHTVTRINIQFVKYTVHYLKIDNMADDRHHRILNYSFLNKLLLILVKLQLELANPPLGPDFCKFACCDIVSVMFQCLTISVLLGQRTFFLPDYGETKRMGYDFSSLCMYVCLDLRYVFIGF